MMFAAIFSSSSTQAMRVMAERRVSVGDVRHVDVQNTALRTISNAGIHLEAAVFRIQTEHAALPILHEISDASFDSSAAELIAAAALEVVRESDEEIGIRLRDSGVRAGGEGRDIPLLIEARCLQARERRRLRRDRTVIRGRNSRSLSIGRVLIVKMMKCRIV